MYNWNVFNILGANSFGSYAVKIFRQTFADMNPHGGAIAVSFVQLLAAMLSGLLIDTVGRIPLLIISSVFMSLALASFGSYVYYEEVNKAIAGTNFDIDTAAIVNTDWIPLLCVLVFTIAFSLGKHRFRIKEFQIQTNKWIEQLNFMLESNANSNNQNVSHINDNKIITVYFALMSTMSKMKFGRWNQ